MLEQLSLDMNVLTEAKDLSAETKGEAFSCCYRYRECSDNKECVMSNNSDSINCAYRKNLENRIIFYGKNAVDFNNDDYNNWVSIYHKLDNKAIYELNCIISYYEKYRFGLICYNSPEIENLTRLGFITKSIPKMDILKKCSKNTLQSFFNEKVIQELKQNARSRRGNRAQPKKEEYLDYIINNSVPEADAFVNKYAYVGVSPAFRTYIFEFYYEFIKITIPNMLLNH